jgi:uncharacterized membrane protein
MFCKNCGRKINANELFCGNCGAKVFQTGSNTATPAHNQLTYDEISKKGIVTMINHATGEQFQARIGWSWILFIFSNIFGIPWFMRKIYDIACAWIVLDILIIFLTPVFNVKAGAVDFIQVVLNNRLYMFASLICLGFSFFCGLKGNEITIKRYLKRGYEIF